MTTVALDDTIETCMELMTTHHIAISRSLIMGR